MRCRSSPTSLRIGVQQSRSARILRLFDQFGQGQRVAQAQVEALRADGMDGLRGVASNTAREATVRSATTLMIG